MPPNEKRGRRHSSEVTVVVLPEFEAVTPLNLKDVKIDTKRGSGPGGQHRNKTESMVVATHVPSGMVATCDGRSQHQNRERALAVLAARVEQIHVTKEMDRCNSARKASMGTDREYTWTDWRDEVVHHRSGRKLPMKSALKGRLEKFDV